MRFWDASAIVPLVINEPSSAAVLGVFEGDPTMLVWWATETECASAIARREREATLTARDVKAATERLAALAAAWREVQPGVRVRQTAARILRVHPLRAGDALQLAAAIVAADGDPRTLPLVVLDGSLARAAEREGFPVVEPAVLPA